MTTPYPPMTTPVYGRELEVWRPQTSGDGAGGQTVDFAPVGTVGAQVSQPTAVEQQRAAQSGALLTHVIHTAPDEDVQRGDELRRDGEVFRVLSVVLPSHPVYLRANVERVQSEPEVPSS